MYIKSLGSLCPAISGEFLSAFQFVGRVATKSFLTSRRIFNFKEGTSLWRMGDIKVDSLLRGVLRFKLADLSI